MKRFASAMALAIGLTSAAYADTFGPLVEVSELSAAMETAKPVLLDIRGKGYEEGHVVGALSAPYGLFRGPANNPGGLVDVEVLETAFEQLGLTQDAPIVIISAGKTNTDFGASARVYWTLKSTGFSDLSILNGGQDAWQTAGLPINTEITTVTPTELDLTFSNEWLATTRDVAAVASGEADAILVDSRPEAFYKGEKAHKAAERPGTLPMAINHSYTTFFEDGAPAISKISNPAALKASLGVEDGKDVVSFCNTGHWAATHWFAVSELAGVDNAKLYAGSMVEYSQSGNTMANVPGLLENLINQVVK